MSRTKASEADVGLAIELNALQVDGWADRGIGRYLSGYANALDRAGVLEVALLDPRQPPPSSGLPPNFVYQGRLEWDGPRACRNHAHPGLWHHVTAPFLGFENERARVGGGPWERSGVPRAAVLYDLIPLQAPAHYLAGADREARYRRRAEWVAQSDLLLTISEGTRSEAMEILGCDPEQVVTIGAGVSDFFSPPDGTDDGNWAPVAERLGDRPFVLTVAGSDDRKGGSTVIAAVGRLVERGYDLALVVVGHLTDDWQRRLAAEATACGVSERVIRLGAVNDDLLRAAYRRAAVTVLPSLAEGAGLPVLESAACGTPALASARSSLEATASTPLATFDPTDTDDVADVLAATLDSPWRWRRILAAQQETARSATWPAVAGRAVAAMTARTPARRPSPPGPRLAVVGGPPDDAARTGWPGVEVDLFGLAELPDLDTLAGYDAVVYRLGPGDGQLREVASLCPGWLWPAGVAAGGPPGGLEPLLRRSSGLVVDDADHWAWVRLTLDPWSAQPPVVVAAEAGSALADRLLGEGRDG